MANTNLSRAVKLALVAASFSGAAAVAQDQAELEQVVVTGTRITLPGVESSSPIYSVGSAEIEILQQPEVEKIVRILPISAPSDGQNANNGTAGAATINLRGLGAQRNLILMDGKRLTPYNFNGLVDTSIIPTALVERLDIITGGASAVYGSDAISGALNFVMKKDFEGAELNTDWSMTDKGDGDVKNISLTLGSNVADGRGNVVFGMNWAERDGVLLGSRPLGQLGIETETGAGYEEFLAGEGPTPAPEGCGGPNSVATGGSTTTLPTRVSIAGGPGLGQFRDDGTLGSNCSVFNFNPYNYYQTPQERFGGMAMGHFEINEHAEVYGRFLYSNTAVRQQVAPSGIFATAYFIPLANPFIGDQARQYMIDAANAGRTAIDPETGEPAPTVVTGGDFPNWRDVNGNGVVDSEDYLNISVRRRTVEFGERSTTYNNDAFQLLGGIRGDIAADWTYDLSYQYGSSDRSNVSAGYTNVTNFGNALDTTDGVNCANGDASCVPINIFGGYGSITPEMAAYSSATAIEKQDYEQMIVSGVVSGPIGTLPWVDTPVGFSIGAEYREESAETTPDECWKLSPASCLGGAGGNILPIEGGFNVSEVFAEAIVPLVRDVPFIQSFDLELGYRYSDYNKTGTDETYKYGFNWRPFDELLVRVMQQRAARAPNVGELAAPNTSGLDNASYDPCSEGNPNTITPELEQLCIDTGMTAAQVGNVEDIVSGQINGFFGTDQNALPAPEQADTLTVGMVWTPNWGGETFKNWIFSVDYYDIKIEDVIGEFAAQEVLDGCYVAGQADQCDKVVRVGGTLTLPGSGIELFTTNLDYLQAEGVEVGFSFGVDMADWGDLIVSGNYNKYLTQESQSSALTPVLDCLGFYGTSCGGPLAEDRWIQRTTWSIGIFDLSYLWRHTGSTEIEDVQKPSTYEAFQEIDSYDWIDLYASVNLWENVRVSLGIQNVTEEDPPVVGNEAADTRSNSGNTFPSHFDPLGMVYTVGLNVKF
jgi:outer membrane receptor protein involved in Fe transport